MSLGTISPTSSSVSTLNVTNRDLSLADSSNYYVAVTPTPGTGIITNAGTTNAATTPSLVVFNGGLLNIYLIFLKLSETVVGGGAAVHNFTHSVDQGNRYASGGTALTVNNTNILANAKSSAQVTFGALTAGGATSKSSVIANDWFRGGADVVGDVYEFHYGAPLSTAIGSQIATVASFSRSVAPICIQPQSSYLLNIWAATFTQGITFEVQLAFAEK